MEEPNDTAQLDAWRRMGMWLRSQRDVSMQSRAQVAERGGPSVSTQQQLEDGGRRTRGEWVLPSPDEKTWGKLCAAAEVHPEELRHQGAVLGLWEHEDFPIAAIVRHMEATLSEARGHAAPGARPVASFHHARTRFDDLLDQLAEHLEVLSIPDLERLVGLADDLAHAAGETQVEHYLADAAKDGIPPGRAVMPEPDDATDDHDNFAQAAKGGPTEEAGKRVRRPKPDPED